MYQRQKLDKMGAGNYEWLVRLTAYCPDLSDVKVGDEVVLKGAKEYDVKLELKGRTVVVHSSILFPAIHSYIIGIFEDNPDARVKLKITKCGFKLDRHSNNASTYDNIEIEVAADMQTLNHIPELYLDDMTTAVHLLKGCNHLQIDYENTSRSNDIEWVVDDDCRMYYYDDENNVLMSGRYLMWGRDDSKIPYGTYKIMCEAFRGCKNLSVVNIPDSVVFIGDNAFNGCENLRQVTFGKQSNIIGYSAFEGCSKLESIILPEQLQCIKPKAFKGCSSLKSVVALNNSIMISEDAFEGCPNLKPENINGSIKWMKPELPFEDSDEGMWRYCLGM